MLRGLSQAPSKSEDNCPTLGNAVGDSQTLGLIDEAVEEFFRAKVCVAAANCNFVPLTCFRLNNVILLWID